MAQAGPSKSQWGSKVAVQLGALLSRHEFEFEVMNEEAEFSEAESVTPSDLVYDFSALQEQVDLDCIQASDPTALPFEELETKMTECWEDGKVKKRVLKAGTVAIPDGAVVRIHYNCYTEMEEVPFDSTYLRSKNPVRHQLGESLFLGFEIALKTMTVGEKAQFLIHPDLAYGELGVPPRIPPAATIMIIIEVIRLDSSPVEEPLNLQDRRNFQLVYERAKYLNHDANKCICEGSLYLGINLYRKCEDLLLGCSLDNDEQEDKYKRLLLKVYSNLAVCYNSPRVNQPKRVCVVIRKAFELDPKNASKNPKLFYNRGVALMNLAEYSRARSDLMRAQRLAPDNDDIKRQIETLQKKVQSYKEYEQASCAAALGFSKPPPVDIASLPDVIDEECKTAVSRLLEGFANGDEAVLNLPSEYTPAERECLRSESKRLGLDYLESSIGRHRFCIRILKARHPERQRKNDQKTS